MEAESKGKFTYHDYIKHGKYPETLEKDKLTFRKQYKLFQVQEMHVYYFGGIFYVIVGLVIDPSLPKFEKDQQLETIG